MKTAWRERHSCRECQESTPRKLLDVQTGEVCAIDDLILCKQDNTVRDAESLACPIFKMKAETQ